MAGAKLKELKQSIWNFIDLIQKMDLGERISIISFGGEVRLLSELTRDYAKLKNIVSALVANGGTPMGSALKGAFQLLQYTKPLVIGPITLMPRVILFTDGEPDQNCRQEVIQLAKLMGQGLPMVCIGVEGCDRVLMQQLAQLSGGMFLMASDIAYLQLFFVRQVLLISYIMEAQKEISTLYNRELLRQYLEQRSGGTVSDEELDGFIYFMQHLVKNTDEPSHKKCCCCDLSCRNFITTLLFLICLSALGWGGYACHQILNNSYAGVSSSNAVFGATAFIIAMVFNCACSCHLIYLRSKDDESILWLIEVLTVMFLIVPEALLLTAALHTDGTYVIPSAIALVSVMGSCVICNCCVRCCNSNK